MNQVPDTPNRDVIALYDGTILETHSAGQCHGQICCIHNPTDHHMREWPQYWRRDRRLMERVSARCGTSGSGRPPHSYRTRHRRARLLLMLYSSRKEERCLKEFLIRLTVVTAPRYGETATL